MTMEILLGAYRNGGESIWVSYCFPVGVLVVFSLFTLFLVFLIVYEFFDFLGPTCSYDSHTIYK